MKSIYGESLLPDKKMVTFYNQIQQWKALGNTTCMGQGELFADSFSVPSIINLTITRSSGVPLIGDLQEEQGHLLLTFKHNSMSNLLCTGAICMNTTQNVVPLYNVPLYTKLPLIKL